MVWYKNVLADWQFCCITLFSVCEKINSFGFLSAEVTFSARRMQFVWCCAADVAQTQRVQLGSDESRCRRGRDEESSGQDTARDHRQQLVARQRPPAAAAAFTHVTVCQCSRLWHQPLTATDHRLQSHQRLWGALSLYCASWHWCKHTHTPV